MKKVINAATCDARKATEESFAGFDRIVINAAVLLVGERTRELMNRYPVTLNVASVLEIPDGQDISFRSINGSGEIGPDSDGTGTLLLVNGKLVIADGSAEAVKSYYRIIVNGKVLMPESMKGQFSNIQVNGSTEYYPDGAAILKNGTEIDSLFVERASRPLYYSSRKIFFLDAGIDTDKLAAKGVRFAAKKIVIADSLVSRLIPLLDEEAEIVRVPDGTRRIKDDIELKPKTIRKYGTKLLVSGDVTIEDAEALASLEYLYADGTVRVHKDLEDAFEEIESVYSELMIIDPDKGYISDRPFAKVGMAVIEKYPNGVYVSDCAKVTIAEDLSPELIMEKLHISDCAVVVCTKEQEEAVHMIAEDVAVIRTGQGSEAGEGQEEDGGKDPSGFEGLGSLFGKMKDSQVINAAEYTM